KSLVRKKLILREDLSRQRDATRREKFAVFRERPGRCNEKQQQIIETLEQAGGRMKLDDLRATKISQGSFQTLVKSGAIAIEEEAVEAAGPTMKARTTLEFLFTPSQQAALKHIHAAVASRQLSVTLLHGV